MSLSTSRTVQWQQHVQWVRGGGDGGERSRASLDRSIGPASAWPCYPPQPQLELTTQRAPLVERKVEGGRRKQRPASAPVRSDTGSSDASAAIAARPSSALADSARQRWTARLETAAVLASTANPNHSRTEPVAKRRSRSSWRVTAQLSDEAAPAPRPLAARRTRRRPHSAAPRPSTALSAGAAPRPNRPASAGPRVADTSSVAGFSQSAESSRRTGLRPARGRGWSASRSRQLGTLSLPTRPAIARCWHSLCDPGFGKCAHDATLAAYTQASGLREARRTNAQASWLSKVGSGTVLNLALARRRLAFASQLLPSGIIRKQTPESAVLRLTHAEMLAEREARLTVLQREEGKWTAEEHEAAVELAALQREIEAMEAIELELARAYGAVEAEMWTVKMKERVSSPRGGEAFRTVSAHAQHQAAHRSRCLSGRGRCRLLLGCETEALQDFEAALVAFPESLEALWGKSEALDQLGRTAEATAALAKHDRLLSRQEGSSELESAPEEPDEELPMSGVSVSGVSDSDRSELVLPFFDAGLPAFHRVDALQPAASIARTDRKAGNTLTAKWMGRKTLLVLLAWQSWASGCVLFREQVKAVLRSARDVFTARNHERLAELSLVYELPLSAVASEQNRHGQLCTGAAEAMVGCEDLVRQKAAWQAGTGREPDLTGRQALLTEQKLALSVKYNERAHDLQGRLVQAHGKGVQATLVSMRRIVIAKAGTCDARGRTAKRALHNIQKEAVQVAAVDASVTGEPIRDKVVTMGPLFWTVMLGNLARNARKVEAALAAGKADSSDAVEPSRRTFASLAVAALADARLLSQDNKATAGIGQAPNDVLDVEIVRWVCSRVDLSLMWSWSEEAADKQSPSTAVEASDNDAADTEATLRRLERRLALVDLGITKSMWSGGSSWSGIDRQLIRHVLSFCEPPGLLAAAGSCRQIRAAMHDGGWDALQALRDTHVSVAVSQLGRIAASVSRRSDARSAGIERVGSLMAQTKRLLLGLDDMDLVTASLSHRPTTTLEFVCEALSQLLTLSEDGTDGAAAKPLAESQGSIQEDTNVEGHRDTSLAFLFKADADVYDPTSGTSRQRLKNRWEERSNSIETASVSMVSAQPANHWLESRRRYNRSTGSDSGANRRPGSGSSFLSSASSISLPSRPSSALASSYVSSLVHRHAHAQEEISHSLLLGLDPALPSTHEEEQDSLSSVVATEDGATKGTWWWKPASDGSDGGYDKSTDRAHTGMGSRWDLGSKALRTVVSTRLLELSEPGGGASFHALMMASTAARRATVRRLLPYTATLLGELQRRREEGALRDASIEGRVAAGLGSFVVAIDAQLRVSCGLCAEGEAVIAEAQATRVAELCKACAR